MTQEQGLSLRDIAPQSTLVPIDDKQKLEVFGVSAQDLLTLFNRFPSVHGWMMGGETTPADMLRTMPEVGAAIIAAGCHALGDEIAEKKAQSLSVEAQLDCLEAIAKLTFRSGFGPFADRMAALVAVASSVNYGRVQGTKSPPQSKPLSPADTTSEQSGS